MEESGGFVFICHQPLVVIHKDSFEPVIYPDGHPNPGAVQEEGVTGRRGQPDAMD